MKRYALITCLLITAIIFSTCRKEYELPESSNKIEITGDLINSIGYRDVIIETTIGGLGDNKIIQHGHCWGIESMPSVSGNHTQLGQLNSAGKFSSTIQSLNPNTRYYFRSYIQTATQTIYGSQKETWTLKTGMPRVTTSAITNLKAFSVTCGGTVESDSGFAVTARGICWDKDSDFTLAHCLGKSENNSGLGAFTYTITNLNPSTPYFIKAYAINQVDTAYGDIKNPTTLTLFLPEVLTEDIDYIWANSAILGGRVLSEGNGNVTERGVCWAIDYTPTYEHHLGMESIGQGTGPFSKIIYNLNSNQDYKVVAYAINEKGINYGLERGFTTNCDTPYVATGYFQNITSTTLTVKGNMVTNEGGCSVTARGICWSRTNPLPTLEDCEAWQADTQGGLGTYNIDVTNLIPHAIYYFRAYASNGDATDYGDTIRGQMQSGPCDGQTSLSKYHTVNGIAPVNKNVIYQLAEIDLNGISKCWIKQNLGANYTAYSATDASEESAGWYWQFNRKQGYNHTGTLRTPATAWITPISENNDWQLAQDPCALLLGTGWRLPTSAEWDNIDATWGWDNYSDSYASLLKMHAAGYLSYTDGSLASRGSIGLYWSGSQSDANNGRVLYITSGFCQMHSYYKARGMPVRCLKD